MYINVYIIKVKCNINILDCIKEQSLKTIYNEKDESMLIMLL